MTQLRKSSHTCSQLKSLETVLHWVPFSVRTTTESIRALAGWLGGRKCYKNYVQVLQGCDVLPPETTSLLEMGLKFINTPTKTSKNIKPYSIPFFRDRVSCISGWPRNHLYCWGWSWISDHSVPVSQVLGFQMCTTMPTLYCAGNLA